MDITDPSAAAQRQAEHTVRALHVCAAAAENLDRIRYERNQPAVERIAVDVQVMPRIVACLPAADVDCAHGKDLRIDQHAFGKRQVKVRKCLLGVRCE